MRGARLRPPIARSRLAWPLAAPLLAAGLLAGHDLSYRLVTLDAATRAHFLERTGHGYLAFAPLAAALAAALLSVALVWRAARSLRGLPAATAPAWLFAALPPIAFTLQEHLERLVHDGAVPLDLPRQPVFLLGLALQLPFALAAVVVARTLESVAGSAARALGRPPLPRLHAGACTRPAGAISRARLRSFALACSVRGPPLAA